MNRLITIGLVLLMIATGCQADMPGKTLETGTISVTVVPAEGKGAESTGMEPDRYTVILKNTDKNIEYPEFTGSVRRFDYTRTVASGRTNVSVIAYNSIGDRIGSGSGSLTVIPNELNHCVITINVEEGDSRLVLNVDTETTHTDLTAYVYAPNENPDTGKAVYSFPLKKSEKGYTGNIAIGSGYWKVFVRDAKGNLMATPISIRAIKDIPVIANVVLGDSWDVDLEIKNNIEATPEIVFLDYRESYAKGEIVTLGALVSDMTEQGVKWFFDNEPIVSVSEEDSSHVSFRIPEGPGMNPGKHYFTVIFWNDTITWSDTLEVSITEPQIP